MEITERAGSNLKWSSMADNAVFGMEYFLKGIQKQNRDILLQEGIKLCEMLEEEITDKTLINDSKLEAYFAIRSLTTISNEHSAVNVTELNDITQKVKEIKIHLQNMIEFKKKYSEGEIRKFQQFFNNVSEPYLRNALQDIYKIETIKGKQYDRMMREYTIPQIHAEMTWEQRHEIAKLI